MTRNASILPIPRQRAGNHRGGFSFQGALQREVFAACGHHWRWGYWRPSGRLAGARRETQCHSVRDTPALHMSPRTAGKTGSDPVAELVRARPQRRQSACVELRSPVRQARRVGQATPLQIHHPPAADNVLSAGDRRCARGCREGSGVATSQGSERPIVPAGHRSSTWWRMGGTA